MGRRLTTTAAGWIAVGLGAVHMVVAPLEDRRTLAGAWADGWWDTAAPAGACCHAHEVGRSSPAMVSYVRTRSQVICCRAMKRSSLISHVHTNEMALGDLGRSSMDP